MEFKNFVLATALALGMVWLAGCTATPVDGLGAPSPTSAGVGEVANVDELRDAFVSAGGDCSEWSQTDRVANATASGSCTDATVLMVFETKAKRDATVGALEGLTMAGEKRVLLIGPNWLINSPAAADVEEEMGGLLRVSTGPTATPTPTPTVSSVTRMEYSGTGDMVQEIGNFTELAVLTFRCDDCTRNTQLKSNGDESLIVNEIGAYSGSHLINLYDNSMTTRFEIVATGSWTLVIDDVKTLQRFTGAATGAGDTAFVMDGTSTAAEITNDGESNFQVFTYGTGSASPMVVNEIGGYSGVRPFSSPAFVQVISSGSWSITPR